jgi:hypothetical protein
MSVTVTETPKLSIQIASKGACHQKAEYVFTGCFHGVAVTGYAQLRPAMPGRLHLVTPGHARPPGQLHLVTPGYSLAMPGRLCPAIARPRPADDTAQ